MDLFKSTLIVVGIVIVTLFATISMIQTSSSRNGGARRELMASLRTERNGFRPDPAGASAPAHPEDFIPHLSDDGDRTSNATALIAKHGVALKWYLDGRYQEVTFYPLALSNTVRIEALPEPLPILVMVPLDPIDLKTIPTLHGCGPLDGSKAFERQSSRMKELFLRHEVNYVTTLLSDGSLWHFEVNDLFDHIK